MNFSNIKKLVLPLFAVAVFSACDKAKTTDQLADKGQNMIRVLDYGGVDANFPNSNISLDPSVPSQTIEFQLEYVGPQVFGNDLTITVAVNDAARTAYNAAGSLIQYESMPAGSYTLDVSSAVIKAGGVFSTPLSITILDASLFDPAVSYMLPVSITNVAGGSNGVKGAPSTGTAYFHIIGNPLAGDYLANGYFYHPSAPRDIIDEPKTLAPFSPDELYCDLGDLGTSGYVAIFKTNPTTNKVTIRAAPGAAGGAYTQFDTDFPAFPGYSPAWPNSAQCNNTYDPTTKTFKVRYGYLNTATGYRVTEEFIVKQ